MDDGALTPLGHDGMAAFPGPDGSIRVLRNHEERTGAATAMPSGLDPARRYDHRGGGGTSTLQVRFDGVTPVLETAWMSLAGTIVNCAGGPTPWGSWLSCEETTAGIANGWTREHGYVFEVPSSADTLVTPVPLTAMGRFVHEAVAVDPDTGIVYETEDRNTAGFYRFLPDEPGNLAAGGRLQMLKLRDHWQYDTRTGQRIGEQLAAEWVDMDDPDPVDAGSNALAVWRQGNGKGGATFRRLEGCWWGIGAVYFTSTNGGDIGEGQVWKYTPTTSSEGTLELVYESRDSAILSFPDNLTVSPGGALVICEDTSRRMHYALQVLSADGSIFPFCIHEGLDEWCGACFSPDGRILFANLQGSNSGDPSNPATYATPGRTIAIWGPWENGVIG